MILVDTSVWLRYLRDRERTVAEVIEPLMDDDAVILSAIVELELASGAPLRQRPQLRRLLNALPVIVPSRDTFALAGRWIEQGRARGHVFGATDLLIAATAAERGARVWSFDSDFRRLAQLGVIRLFAPGAREALSPAPAW